MQEMVAYAWQLSHDMDFIYTIEGESGFNPAAINHNRDGSVDRGIAQINAYFHPEIVHDKRFADWRWQLEQGWKMYRGGVRFYAYDTRWKHVPDFILADK